MTMGKGYKTLGTCRRCNKKFVLEEGKYLPYASKFYCEQCRPLFSQASSSTE